MQEWWPCATAQIFEQRITAVVVHKVRKSSLPFAVVHSIWCNLAHEEAHSTARQQEPRLNKPGDMRKYASRNTQQMAELAQCVTTLCCCTDSAGESRGRTSMSVT